MDSITTRGHPGIGVGVIGGILGGFLIVATLFNSAEAVTVHTWLDAQGQRHYADVPPVDDDTLAERIEFDDGPLNVADANADYYSITNQWARMRAERDAADALALQRDRLRAERRPPPQTPPPPTYRSGVYANYPIYAGGLQVYPRRLGYGGGRSSGDRGAYLNDKRRRAFVPRGVPAWPRQR